MHILVTAVNGKPQFDTNQIDKLISEYTNVAIHDPVVPTKHAFSMSDKLKGEVVNLQLQEATDSIDTNEDSFTKQQKREWLQCPYQKTFRLHY